MLLYELWEKGTSILPQLLSGGHDQTFKSLHTTPGADFNYTERTYDRWIRRLNTEEASRNATLQTVENSQRTKRTKSGEVRRRSVELCSQNTYCVGDGEVSAWIYSIAMRPARKNICFVIVHSDAKMSHFSF